MNNNTWIYDAEFHIRCNHNDATTCYTPNNVEKYIEKKFNMENIVPIDTDLSNFYFDGINLYELTCFCRDHKNFKKCQVDQYCNLKDFLMLRTQASFAEMSITAVLQQKLSSLGMKNLHKFTDGELFDLLQDYVLEQEHLTLKNMYWNRHSI